MWLRQWQLLKQFGFEEFFKMLAKVKKKEQKDSATTNQPLPLERIQFATTVQNT